MDRSGLSALDGDGDQWLELVRAAERRRDPVRLGGYEVLEEVRHGAQGLVFRALQPGTGREIALKRLVGGKWTSPAERRRFEREIEIVAGLDHPGIVAVHGVEFLDDVPLLAMEWVAGASFTESAARLPRDRAGLRARLALYLQVCDAVQYAHQRGVIHRDLKPSNILVDGTGRCRLLDFGLAQRVPSGASPDVTRTLGFLGTPGYAAPEHFTSGESPIDARSDVYSLGVILYECLAGRRPFEAERISDLIRAIETEDPPRLRTLAPEVERELEAIVLRALSKRPEERYPTVHALSEDVRAFLSGRPVSAVPPSPLYLARKWIGRNRLASGFTLTLVLTSLAFGIVSRRQARGLERQRIAAETQRNLADQARADAVAALGVAEEHRREAAEALEEVQRQAGKARSIQDFYLDLVYAPDYALQSEGVRTVQDLRELAHKRVRTVFHDRPEIVVELESQIAMDLSSQGRLDEAVATASAALELEGRLEEPRVSHRGLLQRTLGDVELARGNLEKARSWLERAVETIDSLGEANPSPRTLATTLVSLSIAQSTLGDMEEAIASLRRSCAITASVDDSVPGFDRMVPRVHLADLLMRHGDVAEAEALVLENLARCEADPTATFFTRCNAWSGAGMHYLQRDDPGRAVEYFERCIDEAVSHVPADDQNLLLWRKLLGLGLEEAGRAEEAALQFQEIVARAADAVSVAVAHTHLGDREQAQGRLEAAVEHFRLSIQGFGTIISSGDDLRLDAMLGQAEALVGLERFDEAESLFLASLQEIRLNARQGNVLPEASRERLAPLGLVLGREDQVAELLTEVGPAGAGAAPRAR